MSYLMYSKCPVGSVSRKTSVKPLHILGLYLPGRIKPLD